MEKNHLATNVIEASGLSVPSKNATNLKYSNEGQGETIRESVWK